MGTRNASLGFRTFSGLKKLYAEYNFKAARLSGILGGHKFKYTENTKKAVSPVPGIPGTSPSILILAGNPVGPGTYLSGMIGRLARCVRTDDRPINRP